MPRKKKKAKSGEGSFRLKPSGLIEYRFSYKDEFGQSARKSFACKTREECLAKAEDGRVSDRSSKTSTGIGY